MFIYLIETKDFCKIGATQNIEQRFRSYSFDTRVSHVVEVLGANDKDKALFIESYVCCQFNSSEYIYYKKISDVLPFLEKAISLIPEEIFMFSLFGVPLSYNNDGYVCLNKVLLNINKYRSEIMADLARIDAYKKNKSTKEFLSTVALKYGKKPIISKQGGYGGTYALPCVVIDFILWRAGNKWRISNDMPMFVLSEYFRRKGTVEFVEELEKKLGKVKINSRGKNSHTWVHPFLFVDLALAISPKLKIETYQWIFDKLIKIRNDSGDSYKKMCGAIYGIIGNKAMFPKKIQEVAKCIQVECGVSDWQTASEWQLALRDRIHENVFLLSDFIRDVDKCVSVSIFKANESLKQNINE